MSRHHLFFPVVGALIVALGLAGCGGGEGGGDAAVTRVQLTSAQLAAFETERLAVAELRSQSVDEPTLEASGRDQPQTFDFCARGSGQTANSGSFSVSLAQNAIRKLGTIPAGVKGLQIKLQATRDLDIQLLRASNQFEYVGWPSGLLSGATTSSTHSDGMVIRYSGYNGDGTGLGNEWIEVDETKLELQMNVFAFQAGSAVVTYKWTSAAGVGACDGIATKGNKSFSSPVVQGQRVLVGEIPEGVANLVVALESSSDLDIQLVETETNAEVVNWLAGPFKSKSDFYFDPSLRISYSGYNGDGRGWGYEYLRIEGKTKKRYSLYAFGYQAGASIVRYSWDDNTSRQTYLMLLRDASPARIMARTYCPAGTPAHQCAVFDKGVNIPYGFWSHVALISSVGPLELRVIHSHPSDAGVSRAIYDLKRTTVDGSVSPTVGIFAPYNAAGFSVSKAIAAAESRIGRPYRSFWDPVGGDFCTDLVAAAYAAGGVSVHGSLPDSLLETLQLVNSITVHQSVYQ